MIRRCVAWSNNFRQVQAAPGEASENPAGTSSDIMKGRLVLVVGFLHRKAAHDNFKQRASWHLSSKLLANLHATARVKKRGGTSNVDFAEVSLLNAAVQDTWPHYSPSYMFQYPSNSLPLGHTEEMWPEITSFIRTVLKETVEAGRLLEEKS